MTRPIIHAPSLLTVVATEFELRRVTHPCALASALKNAAYDVGPALADALDEMAEMFHGPYAEPWDDDPQGRPRWALRAADWEVIKLIVKLDGRRKVRPAG